MQRKYVYQLQDLRYALGGSVVEALLVKNRRLLRVDIDQNKRDGPESVEEEGPAGAAAERGGQEGRRDQQKDKRIAGRTDPDVPVGPQGTAGHLQEQTQLPHLRTTRNQEAVRLHPMDGELLEVWVQCSTTQQLSCCLDQTPQTPQGNTQHRQHTRYHWYEA